MMAMIPMLGIGVNLDRDAAVANAGTLLHQLGVQGKLRLDTAKEEDMNTSHPRWGISFKSDAGWALVSLDAHSGQVTQFTIHEGTLDGQQPPRPPTVQEVRTIRKTLGLVGFSKDIAPCSGVGFPEYGPYHLLCHGHPFFNLNPTYGPALMINWRTGRPAIYYAPPALPPVNSWKPTVKPAVALAELRKWGHAQAVARGLPCQVDPSEGHLVAELGYWKSQHKKSAQLVWRATKYVTIQGHPYGCGALPMYMDALTGEFVDPSRS